MEIAVFAYDFPHKKTQDTIFTLMLSGYKPEVIFAAPWKELKFYKSKIRTSPKYEHLFHPKKIAEFFEIPYLSIPHENKKIVEIVKKRHIELGIVAGARILKKHIIDAFPIGILNMHPGLLPENRGLDTIKWAIVHCLKQGVTTHLIDERIDRGKLIDRKPIEVYEDDTLVDIHIRIQELEQKMMIDAIKKLEGGFQPKEFNSEGIYHSSMPLEEEMLLEQKFEFYKKYYKFMKV